MLTVVGKQNNQKFRTGVRRKTFHEKGQGQHCQHAQQKLVYERAITDLRDDDLGYWQGHLHQKGVGRGEKLDRRLSGLSGN